MTEPERTEQTLEKLIEEVLLRADLTTLMDVYEEQLREAYDDIETFQRDWATFIDGDVQLTVT